MSDSVPTQCPYLAGNLKNAMKGTPKGKKPKSKIGTYLRVALTVIFLFLAYKAVSAENLIQTLSKLHVSAVISLVGIYTIGQCVSAFRWRVFVRQTGIIRPLADEMRAYFFGMFVNAFGIGTIGGDLARALALRPMRGERAAALATVVADRVHGLATLLTIGAVAVLLVRPPMFGNQAIGLAILVIIGLGVFWWLGPVALLRFFPAHHRFGKAAEAAAKAFPRRPAPFLLATGLSCTLHIIQIYMHYVMARELGAPLSFGMLCATVPLVNTAASLPLTINGVGLREAMYVMLFVPLGVPQETAVAFGAVWILVVTLVSAVGGFLLRPKFELTWDAADSEVGNSEQFADSAKDKLQVQASR